MMNEIMDMIGYIFKLLISISVVAFVGTVIVGTGIMIFMFIVYEKYFKDKDK